MAENENDDCFFLDVMGIAELKQRMQVSMDRIAEEHRVISGIVDRIKAATHA